MRKTALESRLRESKTHRTLRLVYRRRAKTERTRQRTASQEDFLSMCWLSNRKNLTKYISKLYGSLYLRDVQGGNFRWKKFPYKLLYSAMDGDICIGNHMISRAIGNK